MSPQALGILLFCIIILISFSSFFLRFGNQKIINNYFFWAVPALCFFIYFVAIRYFNDWNDFFKDTSFITGGDLVGTPYGIYRQSILISKALLLDLCPFLGIFIPASLILDKTRKTSYIMAPFAILGGVVSFGSILGGISPGGDVKFTFEYLFIGYEG
ncbi:MAG: DUF5378 family protein, partial [Mycoplasmoidaceae bacterium]